MSARGPVVGTGRRSSAVPADGAPDVGGQAEAVRRQPGERPRAYGRARRPRVVEYGDLGGQVLRAIPESRPRDGARVAAGGSRGLHSTAFVTNSGRRGRGPAAPSSRAKFAPLRAPSSGRPCVTAEAPGASATNRTRGASDPLAGPARRARPAPPPGSAGQAWTRATSAGKPHRTGIASGDDASRGGRAAGAGTRGRGHSVPPVGFAILRGGQRDRAPRAHRPANTKKSDADGRDPCLSRER